MKALALYACCLALASCGTQDFSVQLGRGYRLVRTNGFTTAVFAPNGVEHPSHPSRGVAVPPRIVSCWQAGEKAWGEIQKSPESELSNITTSGWFVLDLGTGVYSLMPDEGACLQQLKRVGVDVSAGRKHL